MIKEKNPLDRKGFARSRLYILCFFLLCLTLEIPSVFAGTFQDAIDGAVDGVVTLIGGETYTGDAWIDSDLIVNGNGARVEMVAGEYISIGGTSEVFFNNLTISGGENGIYASLGVSLTVNGLTIESAANSGFCLNGSTFSITNSTINNCQYGINLYSNALATEISNCSFENNSVSAIRAANSTGVSAIGCHIVGPVGGEEEGISVQDGSYANIIDCDIQGTTAGVTVTDGSNCEIIGSNLHDNKVSESNPSILGQGMYVMGGSSANIRNCTIVNNDNEGIYCHNSQVNISGCLVIGNGWGAEDGSGINCENTSFTIKNTKSCNNYQFGIQVIGNPGFIRGCEIRGNRKGGLHLTSSAPSQDKEVLGCIVDSNNFTGIETYEMVQSGAYTQGTVRNSFFGYNDNIGVLSQNGANIDMFACIVRSNVNYNVNVYLADASLTKCVLEDSRYGLYLNNPSSSYAHGTDILDHTEKGIQAYPVPNPKPDCTNNWWGDPSGPYHWVLNPEGTGTPADGVIFSPWLDAPVSYTCLERGFDLHDAVEKTISFTELPVEFKILPSADSTAQILVSQASLENLFDSLPAPPIQPLEEKPVFLWVNASWEARFHASSASIEFWTSGDLFEHPDTGGVLKYNYESQQWEALPSEYLAGKSALKAMANDIQGCYVLHTLPNTLPDPPPNPKPCMVPILKLLLL